MTARTIFALSGITLKPAKLADAPLILIDYQNAYLDGPLKLAGLDAALTAAAELLAAARAAGTRIIHIAHRSAPGGAFDRDAASGAIIETLTPRPGEIVIEKTRPNAFFGTSLAEALAGAGPDIVVAGFMTHNCVSSTVRAACDLGFRPTLIGAACTTRDLPLGNTVIPAHVLHDAELAGLADHHAILADIADIL